MISTSPYPNWIEVNLAAIERNTQLIGEHVRVPMLAVVKDNGYGHGAAEVARAFLGAGGTWLAVVRVHEGLDLRRAGIDAPVLVFGGAVPAEVDSALIAGLTLPLYGFDVAEMISARARALGLTARVHLKLDTGMGRYGVFADQALALARRALDLGGIEIDGIFSHFALAGDDDEVTQAQIARFKSAVASLNEAGIHPRWVHLANSSGIIHEPGSYFNLVRCGGVLYGLGKNRNYPFRAEVRRAFQWKAQLMSCKAVPAGWGIGYDHDYHAQEGDFIGVVPVGHGDGYRRIPGTSVLVDGCKAPVVGRICMDQFMVRLPRLYPLGTEVVLVGKQGGQIILPEDLQRVWLSTSSGVTLVHPRVPRVYIHDVESMQDY